MNQKRVRMPDLEILESDDPGLQGCLSRLTRFLHALRALVGFIPQPYEVQMHPDDYARLWAWLKGSWTGRPLSSELTPDEFGWLLGIRPELNEALSRGMLMIKTEPQSGGEVGSTPESTAG